MFFTPDQILWSDEGAGLGRISPPRFGGDQKLAQQEYAQVEQAAQRFQALREQLSEARSRLGQWAAQARDLEAQAPGSVRGSVSGVVSQIEDLRAAVDRASSEVDSAESEHDAAYLRVARGGDRRPFTNDKGRKEWDPESYQSAAKQAAQGALARVSPSIGAELQSLARAIEDARARELATEQDRLAREEAARAEQDRLAREEERWRQQEEAARAAEQARLDRQAELEAQRSEREYALEQARWQAEQDRIARMEQMEAERIAREHEARYAQQEAERQRAELQFQLELMRQISDQQKAAGQPGLVPTVGYDPATGQAVVQYQPAPAAPAYGQPSPYGMPYGASPYASQGLPGYAPQPQQPQIMAAGGGWSGQTWTPGGAELFGMRGLGMTDAEFDAAFDPGPGAGWDAQTGYAVTQEDILAQQRADSERFMAEQRASLEAQRKAREAERARIDALNAQRAPVAPAPAPAGPSTVDQAAGLINVFGDAVSKFADIYGGRDRQAAPVQAESTSTMLGLGGLGGLLLAGIGIYAGVKLLDGAGRGRGRRRR